MACVYFKFAFVLPLMCPTYSGTITSTVANNSHDYKTSWKEVNGSSIEDDVQFNYDNESMRKNSTTDDAIISSSNDSSSAFNDNGTTEFNTISISSQESLNTKNGNGDWALDIDNKSVDNSVATVGINVSFVGLSDSKREFNPSTEMPAITWVYVLPSERRVSRFVVAMAVLTTIMIISIVAGLLLLKARRRHPLMENGYVRLRT